MSLPSPTNGELAVMISGLTQEVRDGNTHIKERLASIETKQDHTNGRVRKLEQWKYAMVGGLILGNLIIVPIVVSFISKLISQLGN